MNKLTVCAALSVALTLSGSALARSYDDVIAAGELIVGVYKDFPPYSFQSDDGQPTGLDVELGQAIADGLGVKMRVHWVTPDENLEDDLRNNVWKGHYLDKDEENPMALKKLADVMMRIPYDREYAYRQDVQTGEMVNEQVVMFGPYHRESWRVAYDGTKLESVKTMAVFQYNPVGVEIDSLPDFYLTSAFGGRMSKNVRHYPTPRLAFSAMEEGKVDAVMAMRSEVDYMLHEANNPKYKVAENGFPSMGKQKWDVGMAVKSTYRQLGYAIEDVVDQMVKNGQMAELFGHYGVTYELPGLYQDVQ